MQRVWEESGKQAAALNLTSDNCLTLDYVRSTFDKLVMQVLAVVGFGQDMDSTSVLSGHRESLMQCPSFMLKHLILTLVFHSLEAPEILLPSVLRSLKTSDRELKLYMEELGLRHMQESNSKQLQPQQQATSLLEAMVRANEAEK
ncbi:hypothetical protein B7463_g3045, partial [Scytalidium lignicola]